MGKSNEKKFKETFENNILLDNFHMIFLIVILNKKEISTLEIN